MNRGVSIIDVVIAPASEGWRLDRALAEAAADFSRERVKALLGSGAVIDADGNAARDASAKARAGARYTLHIPAPAALRNEAQHIPLVVAFEDEHLIVVDKPAGLVVHPAAGNRDGTLVNALLHHCGGSLSGIGGVARPGIVHRIDKDTSGLIVAAKTDRAHEGLAKQFAAHSIERRYLAITSGRLAPPNGTIDAPLARSPGNRKKIAIVANGKRAVTHYRTIAPLRTAGLVECRLETGRTHQIRVHMASIGHPLIGDRVYGTASGFSRQALHAARLGFVHPVNSHALAFDSEMPFDMQELFSRLSV